jgi:hypothetical protein
MSARGWLAAAALGAALIAPAAAACPACAGRDDNQSRTLYFLGAMILAPWTVSLAVIFTIRRLQREDGSAPSVENHQGELHTP